jgi:ketosteroid isomerase-like protein
MLATVEDTLAEYHAAVRSFYTGDPEPVKALFAHEADVTLANPFGPAVHGWAQVSEALDYASSRFRGGDLVEVDRGATYLTPELAVIFELEQARAKVGGREDVADFGLRVTSVFRSEGGSWKLVHRHADPITTPSPDGPLRAS